jgi:hypothetical protein
MIKISGNDSNTSVPSPIREYLSWKRSRLGTQTMRAASLTNVSKHAYKISESPGDPPGCESGVIVGQSLELSIRSLSADHANA